MLTHKAPYSVFWARGTLEVITDEWDDLIEAEFELTRQIQRGKLLYLCEPEYLSDVSRPNGIPVFEGAARAHYPEGVRRWDVIAQRKVEEERKRKAREEAEAVIAAAEERKRKAREEAEAFVRERQEAAARQEQLRQLRREWALPPLLWRRPPTSHIDRWQQMSREERITHVAYVNKLSTPGYYAYQYQGLWFVKRGTETTGAFGTLGLAQQWLQEQRVHA